MINIFHHSKAFIEKHKRHHHLALATLALLVAATGTYIYRNEIAHAATYTFTQTSWAGGATATTATHASNQTSWTQYSATSSTSVSPGAGGVTLTSASRSVTDDGSVSSAWATVGSGVNAVAVDPNTGNIYTANYTAGTVSKITPSGTVTTAWATLAAGLYDIAVDPSGNVYTVNNSTNVVSKITPSGTVTATWATVGSGPYAIAIDPSSGDIYTANYTASAVSKITSSGTVTTTWATVGSGPFAIAVDPSTGNVYTANATAGKVSKITPSGTVTTIWATVGTSPRGIAVDSSGNVYVSNNGSNSVSKITSSGTVTASWAAVGFGPQGITVDSAGNVYTANNSAGAVSKITSSGTVTSAWATVAAGVYDIVADSAGTIYVTNTSTAVSRILSAGGFERGAFSSTMATSTGSTASIMLTPSGYLSGKTDYSTLGYTNIAMTADGVSIYGAQSGGTVISLIPRNTSTGALSAKTDYTVGTGVWGVAVSADGASVYATANGANRLSLFPRNTSTGTLGTRVDYTTAASPMGVVVSPDGASVYVLNSGASTISLFPRNTSTGVLGTKTDYTACSNPSRLAASADGLSIYAICNGSNIVSLFPRSTIDGTLSAKTDYATGSGPWAVALSADGTSVYVLNNTASTVSMYPRNTSTGALSAKTDYTTGLSPYAVTVSPDGNSVYVANFNNSLSKFFRTSATGALSLRSDYTYSSGTNPSGVIVSPDNAWVYLANMSLATISRYARAAGSTTGTLTSAVVNLGAKADFTGKTLTWTETLNGLSAGSITMKVHAGNTATVDGTWTTLTSIANGGSLAALSGYRYIQYEATLNTSNLAITPTLDSVAINYAQYPSSANLTSSVYDSGDASNIITKVSWVSSGTSADELVKFQVRSSPDGTTWTNWCGAATSCLGTDYFLQADNGVTFTSGHPLGAGANDRYLQYRIYLTTGGSATPTVSSATVQYVVNAAPIVGNIVPTQVSNSASADFGKISISFDASDADTSTGSAGNQYIVTPTLYEYSANGGSTWTTISSGMSANAYSAITLTGDNATTTTTVTWTPTTGLYVNNAKIRVTVSDAEAANFSGIGTSSTFTIDSLAPSVSVANLDSSGTQDVVNLTATDNSALEYRLCNASDYTGCAAWTTIVSGAANAINWTASGSPTASDAETVYLQVRDAYGNVNSTPTSIVAPATPSNFLVTDTTNVSGGTYREFLSWGVASSSTFGSYKVYYNTTASNASYSLLATVTDVNQNYYTHTITTATSSTHYYKVVTVGSNGDISNFSTIRSDVPDGSGSLDVTAPYIPAAGIATPTVGNASANITFSTYTDTSMATGELATSTVLYGSYSGAVPGSCPASRVDTTTYTVNHSVYLTGLTSGTDYYFCVIARDIAGNASSASTAIGGTFTTASGPRITNVTEREITDTSATIFWNTDTSSDSKVYVATSASGVNSATPVTGSTVTTAGTDGAYQHQIGLTGLSAGQTYYFKVSSTDTAATPLTTTDNNTGNYYSFVTLRDTTPPTISGIATPVLSSSAAVVVWQTDEPATSQVLYGDVTTSRSKFTSEDTTKSIYHVVTLSSSTVNSGAAGGTNELAPSTTYYYVVKSVDVAGNSTTSDEQTLTTPATGNVTIVAVSVTSSSSGDTTKDTTAPTVSNVKVSDITPFGATVAFGTDEDTFASVQYGAATSYGDGASDSAFAKAHTVKLHGLTLGTDYHIKVTATDKSGNIGNSSDQTFKTTFLSENLKDMANITNIEAFQKEIENAIESILPSLVPPFITKPQVTEVTESSATVTFRTNIKAFPIVGYVEQGAYDEAKENPYTGEISDIENKGTEHTLKLTGLKGNTKYHVQARAFSLPKVTGKSSDFTFITKASKIAGSIVERKKDSFTVVWTTEEPTTSIVEFKNLRSGITERKVDSAMKKSHSMKIENLPSGTAYSVDLSGQTESGNIAEAGSPLSVTTSTDVAAPAISGFKVDNALVPGRTDRIQTIVSWTTDEPSNSTVYYEEGAGTAGDTAELANKNEALDSYITNHSIVLPNLKPGTIYRLKVTSSDDSGNLGSFGPRTVITPRQTESITDIIFKNFEDSFKFLQKI